jgi:hypothetical protein
VGKDVREVGQRVTIDKADTANARSGVKCNRCKTRLKPGQCVRDRDKAGYVCREDCR